MKFLLWLNFISFSSISFSQTDYERYNEAGAVTCAGIALNNNNTFQYYDYNGCSCYLPHIKISGTYTQFKDTIIFTYKKKPEDFLVLKIIDTSAKRKNVWSFANRHGAPISNAKVKIKCTTDEPIIYTTNCDGQIFLAKLKDKANADSDSDWIQVSVNDSIINNSVTYHVNLLNMDVQFVCYSITDVLYQQHLKYIKKGNVLEAIHPFLLNWNNDIIGNFKVKLK